MALRPPRLQTMMTTLPPSSSDRPKEDEPGDPFLRLNEKVQRWVWEQNWTALRDIQESAIAPILDGGCDVIISAATAAGKTEAAFLPICSRIIHEPLGGVRALYVSPLKALINDQFDRLDRLCEHLDIPVHRWHGDVAAGDKRTVLANPSGILLITPESLEALFVLRGTALVKLFGGLEFVVVDELHSFIGSERGQQLQSLLSRIELVVRRRIPRIALSATLGDMELAAEFLRPGNALPCRTLVSKGPGQEIRLQVRGYRIEAPLVADDDATDQEDVPGASAAVAQHLFKSLRGTHNLIFANRRKRVEIYADRLRQLCEDASVPNEFWPHHGSLSKELREHAEAAVKDAVMPASIICTTTLEMGIDIGSMASVAQLGPPPSVSSLRQRLGRSGRRGEPAVLRVYVEEPALEPQQAPQDRIRSELVQSIAMVQLLLDKWCEPPVKRALHLSTLVQQVLSVIAQHGGCRADEAYRALCRFGAFPAVGDTVFADLLHAIGTHDLLIQSSDGTLLLGQKGEQLVNHYSFYSVFQITEEYQLVIGGRSLGTLPIDHPIAEGDFLIFGGRRWRILSIDANRRIVELAPSPAGRAPRFASGHGPQIHRRVREQMRLVYDSSDIPPFLDSMGQTLLGEGRAEYQRLGLRRSPLVEYDRSVAVFCWTGDQVLDTLLVQLRARGLKANIEGVALVVDEATPGGLLPHLRALADAGPCDAAELAGTVRNKASERYHPVLDEALLSLDYASSALDAEGAWQATVQTIARIERPEANGA